MTRSRSRLLRLGAKVAIAGAVGVATLLVAEFAVRALMPAGKLLSPTAVREFRERADREAQMIQPDPELGHAPVLGGTVYDENGLLRDWGPRAPGGTADERTVRCLFLGDSVTRRATIVRPLRDLAGPGFEFLNAGVESWNPIQEVEFYFRHQQALRADHVVVSLHNNDLSESTVALMRDGEFTLCNPGSFVALDPDWYGTSILYQLLVHSRHTDRLRPEHYTFRSAEVEIALARLRDEVVGRGARLTVLMLPIFAAKADWREHEQRARELSLAMLQRLDVEWIDLQPTCEELAANGVAVRATPTDTYHPNDDFGALLARAAAPALFAAPSVRVVAEPRLVLPGDTLRVSIDAGPDNEGRSFRVVGPLRSVAEGADQAPSPGATERPPIAGTLQAGGRATVEVTVPADVRPGSIAWHRVLLDRGGGVFEPAGWPAPMIVLPL